MPNYLDTETALRDWLVEHLEAGPAGTHRRVLTELPADLFTPTGMPCHIIERYGGSDTLLGLDIARINIDTLATGTDPHETRAVAIERAEDVRRAIRLHLPRQSLGGVSGAFVVRTTTVTAPTIRPYDSRNQVRRVQAGYELVLHRPI